jgi:hypothetical protein
MKLLPLRRKQTWGEVSIVHTCMIRGKRKTMKEMGKNTGVDDLYVHLVIFAIFHLHNFRTTGIFATLLFLLSKP